MLEELAMNWLPLHRCVPVVLLELRLRDKALKGYPVQKAQAPA
jgi:hypothetical protein